MKLIGSSLEKDILESLILSKKSIFDTNSYNALYKILLGINPNLKTAYILKFIPEQAEDILTVITDDKIIAEIEISRIDPNIKPTCKVYSLHEYKKRLKGKQANLTLLIAMNLIEKDTENYDKEDKRLYIRC